MMIQRKLFVILAALFAFGFIMATPKQDLEGAVQQNNAQAVHRIIREQRLRIESHSWGSFIYSSLCYAARMGNAEIFQLLVTSYNGSPLCFGGSETELLDIIFQNDHTWIIPVVLGKKPEIMRSLLRVAIEKKRYEQFLFLVARGVPIDYEADVHIAQALGNVDALQYMLNQKPEFVERVSNSGHNMLHTAVEYGGGLPVVKFLFEHYPSECSRLLNQQNKWGLTPLHCAAGRQKKDAKSIVEYLLSKGARTDIRTKRGVLPFEKATRHAVMDLLRPPVNAPVNQLQPTAGLSGAEQQASASRLRGLAPLAETAEQQENQDVQRQNEPAPASRMQEQHRNAEIQRQSADQEVCTRPMPRLAHQTGEWPEITSQDVESSFGFPGVNDLIDLTRGPLAWGNELRLPEFGLEDMSRSSAQRNDDQQIGESLGQAIPASIQTDSADASSQASKSEASVPERIPRQLADELIEAAKTGDFDTAQRVLREGADSNLRTALMEAASNGHLRIVRLLLDHRADKNAKDFYGRTVLEEALEKGHLEIVRLLIDRGADVNREPDVKSPLFIAAQNNNLEAVQLLVKSGAKIEMDFGEYSPLNAAVKSGSFVMVLYLVDAGVSLDVHNGQQNPVIVAAQHENLKNGAYLNIAKYLISKKPALAYQSFGAYHTPLHVAAMRGLTTWVSYLNTCDGVKIDCKGLHGETPLHIAARYGFFETAKKLLEVGANPAIQTRRGETAKILAKQNGHDNIVTLLIGYVKRSKSVSQPAESVASSSDEQGIDPDLLQKLLADGGLRRSGRLQARKKRNYCEISDYESETDSADIYEPQKSTRRAKPHNKKSQKRKRRTKPAKPANLESKDTMNVLLQAAVQAGQDEACAPNGRKQDDACQVVSHKLATCPNKENMDALLQAASRLNEREQPVSVDTQSTLSQDDVPLRSDLTQQTPSSKEEEQALLQAVADLASNIVTRPAREKRSASESHAVRPAKKAKATGEFNLQSKRTEHRAGVDAQSLLSSRLKDTIIKALKAVDSQKLDQCLAQHPNLLSLKDGQMGCSLLHSLAHDGDETPFFVLLLQFGGEREKVLNDALHRLTAQRATVLHYATMGGNVAIVKYLISKGLSISSKTDKGVTPFMCAVEKGHAHLVRHMLKLMNDSEKRALVNQPSYEGQLPLIVAAQKGHPEVVDLLISNDAVVDAYDVHGQTALAAAVRKGHTEVIDILRKKGARLDQQLAHNETVEVLARQRQENNQAIMSLLDG